MIHGEKHTDIEIQVNLAQLTYGHLGQIILRAEMMKTLILAIGHLKILKSKTIPAFSLLEIIVVISLISILSYFISFSTNFISSKQNIKTVNEKIKLIELELDYLQKYALSINAFINLDAKINFKT